MRTPELPESPPNIRTFKCCAAHCPEFDKPVAVRFPLVGITMFTIVPVYCLSCAYECKDVTYAR